MENVSSEDLASTTGGDGLLGDNQQDIATLGGIINKNQTIINSYGVSLGTSYDPVATTRIRLLKRNGVLP